MLLVEGHQTQLLPPNEDDSLYVALMVEPCCATAIVGEIQSLGLDRLIPMDQFNLYHPDEYHTTLVFSRRGGKNLYTIAQELETSGKAKEITATITGIKILGNCLVFTLASDELHSTWKRCIDAGASYDFPDYLPHISIGKFDKSASLSSELIIETIAEGLTQSLVGKVIKYYKVASEPLDP